MKFRPRTQENLKLSEEYLSHAATTQRGTNSPLRFLNIATYYSNIREDEDIAVAKFQEYKKIHNASLKMSINSGLTSFQEKQEPISDDEGEYTDSVYFVDNTPENECSYECYYS